MQPTQTGSGYMPQQRRQQDPVGAAGTRVSHLPLQHRELVAQHQDLRIPVVRIPAKRTHRGEQVADVEVDQTHQVTPRMNLSARTVPGGVEV
ncbi:hypothetical protein [Streptomyces sp. NBC_00212]|uniref:hypothetical protein n=1 Tax=Streptomyces sp. NBC_00212 TaxID=2975684 RepID=UPI003254AED2